MQNAIKAEIKRLAQKSFRRSQQEAATIAKHRLQYEKRTGLIAALPKSSYVKLQRHRHYDPAYCARNANFLAKTIWRKVQNSEYEPVPAINYHIPKPDGSKRSIMAFAIPDAALANIVLKRTMQRNLKRLSPSSYAYHPNKNVFDAVLALHEYEPDGKLFAVQIDFEKYFDNIPRKYLESKINNKYQISLTPQERFILSRFIVHSYSPPKIAVSGPYSRRHKGTPQGSSVSLLLANLANHDLDRKLSNSSGSFVRFADDVVALCSSYEAAQSLEKCFLDHCKTSGLTLNTKKSPGIAIISAVSGEMRTYGYFDYLGYRFEGERLTVPAKTISRIKARISRLANLYLIYYLKDGFNYKRSSTGNPVFDWDLLGLIYEIRNSLYGGLTEKQINDFIENGKRLPRMKGLMGFYCLLTDSQALRDLDGWILSTVRRAMKERNRILVSKYGYQCPTPSNRELATGSWLDLSAWRGGDPPEVRMPSLVRGWRAARKYYYTFGLEKVEAPGYNFYSLFDQIDISY